MENLSGEYTLGYAKLVCGFRIVDATDAPYGGSKSFGYLRELGADEHLERSSTGCILDAFILAIGTDRSSSRIDAGSQRA